MAPSRGNKQALCGIFRMFLQLPIHRTTTSLSQKKNITNRYTTGYKPYYKKGMFLSPNPDYSYFSQDIMYRSSESVKIPDSFAY